MSGVRHRSCPPAVAAFASLANYRTRTMRAVMFELGDELAVHAGAPAPDRATRLMDYDAAGIHTFRDYYLLGGRLTVQLLPVRALMAADVAIMDLNPRNAVVWPILVARRLLRRRTLLWGHAWPRAGRGARSDIVRGAMRRLADGLITYTAGQADELRQLYPRKVITPAPNALYHETEFAVTDGAERDAIIYVGRLVSPKKPLLLIEAFDKIAGRHDDLRLVLVGDGEQAKEVAERAQLSPHSSRIELHGFIDDGDSLYGLYSRAIVSASPGYVGLSATQSFAMGVPMVVSRYEPHAPEIEAVSEGQNSEFFETDDATSLAEALERFVVNRDHWANRARDIQTACMSVYSVEAMASGLSTAIRAELDRARRKRQHRPFRRKRS